jgi:hypothetical protein
LVGREGVDVRGLAIVIGEQRPNEDADADEDDDCKTKNR